MAFFFDNPLGKIISRFTKDMIIVDMVLPPMLILVTYGVFRALSVIIAISVVQPYTLIVSFVTIILMTLITKTANRAIV